MSGITAGIPYHAGVDPGHLHAAIESVVNQTCGPTEIHLMRDGPVPSEVMKVVDLYLANKKINIQHLEISENQGLANALNLSIKNTTTKYYARMDADDLSHPLRFEKQVAYLNQNQEIGVLGTWALEFKEHPGEKDTFLKIMPISPKEIESSFHYRCPLVHSSVMFRTEIFDRIGLYDSTFRTRQDLELWGRMLRERIGITNLPEPLLYFRAGGMVDQRSSFSSILRETRARYRYNTLSPKLNLLKIGVLSFRLMPKFVREWGYAHLR